MEGKEADKRFPGFLGSGIKRGGDRANDERGGDTIAGMVFGELLKRMGRSAASNLLDLSEGTVKLDERTEEGFTVEDEELGTWIVTTTDETVSFSYEKWGPYTLPIGQARQIIEFSEQAEAFSDHPDAA